MEVSAPMRVALRQDRGRHAVPTKSAVPLSVVGPLRAFHAGRKKVERNITPGSALRNVLQPLEIDGRELRGRVIVYAIGAAAHLRLVGGEGLAGVRHHALVGAVFEARKVADRV